MAIMTRQSMSGWMGLTAIVSRWWWQTAAPFLRTFLSIFSTRSEAVNVNRAEATDWDLGYILFRKLSRHMVVRSGSALARPTALPSTFEFRAEPDLAY